VFSVHLISIDLFQEVIDDRVEAPWVSDQKIIRSKLFLGLLEFVAAKITSFLNSASIVPHKSNPLSNFPGATGRLFPTEFIQGIAKVDVSIFKVKIFKLIFYFIKLIKSSIDGFGKIFASFDVFVFENITIVIDALKSQLVDGDVVEWVCISRPMDPVCTQFDRRAFEIIALESSTDVIGPFKYEISDAHRIKISRRP
jgi:hypothetical protein